MDNPKTTDAGLCSPAPAGSPRYTATVAMGQWWIEDAHEQRLIAVCTREGDATQIASAMNASRYVKGVCSQCGLTMSLRIGAKGRCEKTGKDFVVIPANKPGQAQRPAGENNG